MSLYLVETVLSQTPIKNEALFKEKLEALERALAQKQAELVEAQVAKDWSRAFWIVESESRGPIEESFRSAGIPTTLIKQVRLVGQDLHAVKKQSRRVNYVVEWNLPENITMEQYLERKRQNSVHYAEVPEVTFARTYVCEDMTKCLCFYDAPDEEAVKRAREAVKAPVDAVTEIIGE